MTSRSLTLSWRLDLLLPCAVALVGLAASLGLTVLAQPGDFRVAVLALPGLGSPWRAIGLSGLPIVRVMLGGRLIVVDAGAGPDGLNILRAANLLLLDASGIPGCGTPAKIDKKDGDHGTDA